MTIIRIGATKKYTSNWGLAFGPKASAKAKTQTKTPAKKSAPPSKKKAPKNKSASGKAK